MQVALNLVGKIDLSKPEGQQVELKEPSKSLVLGQLYLVVFFPMAVMQPYKVVAPEQGPLQLIPLTGRVFSDNCDHCKEDLLKLLCTARGIEYKKDTVSFSAKENIAETSEKLRLVMERLA